MPKSSPEPGSSRPAQRRSRAKDGEPADHKQAEAADQDDGGVAPTRSEPAGRAAAIHAAAQAEGPEAGEKQTRFRIFIIDSGWNSAASKVLHANMPVLEGLTRWDPIYVLDQATSIAVLREHRDLIGRDPIISVHDMWALKRHGHAREHGFRIHLGLLRKEDKVLAALQMLAHFMARFRLSSDLESHVHRELRKAGIAGAIEIVGGGKAHTGLIE